MTPATRLRSKPPPPSTRPASQPATRPMPRKIRIWTRSCDMSGISSGGTGWLFTSDVQRAPIGVEHAFLHRLAERRMREDGVHQVFLGGFEPHGDDEALD